MKNQDLFNIKIQGGEDQDGVHIPTHTLTNDMIKYRPNKKTEVFEVKNINESPLVNDDVTSMTGEISPEGHKGLS